MFTWTCGTVTVTWWPSPTSSFASWAVSTEAGLKSSETQCSSSSIDRTECPQGTLLVQQSGVFWADCLRLGTGSGCSDFYKLHFKFNLSKLLHGFFKLSLVFMFTPTTKALYDTCCFLFVILVEGRINNTPFFFFLMVCVLCLEEKEIIHSVLQYMQAFLFSITFPLCFSCHVSARVTRFRFKL